MTAASRVTTVGIGKETSYDTPVNPTLSVPFTGFTGTDNIQQGVDAAWRGWPSAQFGTLPVGLASKIQLAGPVVPDSIGYPLAGLLGDVTFTSGTPNTWTMAQLNTGSQQPPSYSVTVLDKTGGLRWGGCRWANMQLAYTPTGLLTVDTTLNGQAATTWTGSIPATTEQPLQAWTGALQVAGVADTTLLSARLRFERAVTAKNNTNGSLTPYLQRAGVLTVSGDLSFLCLSDTYRQDAVNGTGMSLDLTWQTGAGAGLRLLRVHCTDVTLTSAVRDYTPKWVALTAAFTASANSTDAGVSGGLSPVKVTLRNQVGSGVYA